MEVQKDKNFIYEKWTLFTFTLIVIVLTIVVLSISASYIDDDYLPTIIFVDVISTLIQFLGLFGVYKEHYGCTLSYAIFMTLIAVASIVTTLDSSINWVSTVFYIIVCVLAYDFARDLRRIKLMAMNHIVYVTGQVAVSGQLRPINGQYKAGPSVRSPTSHMLTNQTQIPLQTHVSQIYQPYVMPTPYMPPPEYTPNESTIQKSVAPAPEWQVEQILNDNPI